MRLKGESEKWTLALFLKPVLLLLAAMLASSTGCVVAPVPTSGEKVAFGTRITTNDLVFMQLGQSTRREVESKLGVPWTNYTALRVSVYCWEMVAGYWVWGGIAPAGGPGVYPFGGSSERTRLDVLFVEYTEDDRVRRFQLLRHPKKKTTDEAAAEWVHSE